VAERQASSLLLSLRRLIVPVTAARATRQRAGPRRDPPVETGGRSGGSPGRGWGTGTVVDLLGSAPTVGATGVHLLSCAQQSNRDAGFPVAGPVWQNRVYRTSRRRDPQTDHPGSLGRCALPAGRRPSHRPRSRRHRPGDDPGHGHRAGGPGAGGGGPGRRPPERLRADRPGPRRRHRHPGRGRPGGQGAAVVGVRPGLDHRPGRAERDGRGHRNSERRDRPGLPGRGRRLPRPARRQARPRERPPFPRAGRRHPHRL
jgi:hypothetical protein